MPTDSQTKAQIMRDFSRPRAAGQPVPPETYARFVAVSNEGFASGPEIGQPVPAFSLPDQDGKSRALADLSGPNGLLLVFYRSADWCPFCRNQLVELQQSRALLERGGIRIAAVSYDAQEILKTFSELNHLGYPLLSDRDSAVIRRFGLFNENMLPEMRSYGVPHPVAYLLSPDGIVREKFFVPNYQHRVTGSEVAMRAGGAGAAAITHIKSGHVEIRIGLSSIEAFAGQELGAIAEFSLAPGWHLYGAPVPRSYTATVIRFETHHVATYGFKFPPPQSMRFEALGETLPVYAGKVTAMGRVLLKFPLQPAEYTLAGTIDLQQCSATECQAPQIIRFQVPIKISATVPEPKRG